METTKTKMYIARYLEDCEFRRRLSRKTMKAYQIDLRQYAEYIGEETENSKKLLEYIHTLNKTYDRHKTVKRKIASIRAFYAYLEYEELIAATPFRKVRCALKEPKRLPKVISSAHIEEIFCCLYQAIEKAESVYERNTSIRNAAVVELLFATGVRISELCGIGEGDIDLEEGTLKIFGKGAKERVLYLGNDSVIHILKLYSSLYEESIRKTGFFFVNRLQHRLSEQSVRLLLRQLEKKLRLPLHITPHMFRHTFATSLLEKEVDIRYIQRILGHSSISITQIYTHVSYPKQREIMTLKNPRNDFERYFNDENGLSKG